MGEDIQEFDVDMINSEITFDNLVILREFSNIVNLVRDEEFLQTVPKAKLRRVQWVPMFNCLKQGIFDEMVKELSDLWQDENMPEKLEILEKQKEHFTEFNSDTTFWRPQLGDVKSQLKATDVRNLRKQKIMLESLARDYDIRVNRLKKIVLAKRGYLKALNMDIQNYQKRSENYKTNIEERFQSIKHILKPAGVNKINVEDLCWAEPDLNE